MAMPTADLTVVLGDNISNGLPLIGWLGFIVYLALMGTTIVLVGLCCEKDSKKTSVRRMSELIARRNARVEFVAPKKDNTRREIARLASLEPAILTKKTMVEKKPIPADKPPSEKPASKADGDKPASVLRRDSIPKRESSKVVILTKAPPVTDLKQQPGGDSTQKLSLVPKIIVDVKPSRRSLICRASSKTANNRKPSVDAKVAEKPNLVGEKSVKGAPLGVKASKILVGEKSVKPAPPVVVKNMWDAAAKS